MPRARPRANGSVCAAQRAVMPATGLILLALAGPCLGQPAPAAPNGDPKACTDRQRLQLGPDNNPRDPSKQDLSDKLAQTEGVLCPPSVDPDIKVPAPETGTMPVVPPPGSPGGEPNVLPK
jgi:hypothetical protein